MRIVSTPVVIYSNTLKIFIDGKPAPLEELTTAVGDGGELSIRMYYPGVRGTCSGIEN
jgi:hypothetical protein